MDWWWKRNVSRNAFVAMQQEQCNRSNAGLVWVVGDFDTKRWEFLFLSCRERVIQIWFHVTPPSVLPSLGVWIKPETREMAAIPARSSQSWFNFESCMVSHVTTGRENLLTPRSRIMQLVGSTERSDQKNYPPDTKSPTPNSAKEVPKRHCKRILLCSMTLFWAFIGLFQVVIDGMCMVIRNVPTKDFSNKEVVSCHRRQSDGLFREVYKVSSGLGPSIKASKNSGWTEQT